MNHFASSLPFLTFDTKTVIFSTYHSLVKNMCSSCATQHDQNVTSVASIRSPNVAPHTMTKCLMR